MLDLAGIKFLMMKREATLHYYCIRSIFKTCLDWLCRDILMTRISARCTDRQVWEIRLVGRIQPPI